MATSVPSPVHQSLTANHILHKQHLILSRSLTSIPSFNFVNVWFPNKRKSCFLTPFTFLCEGLDVSIVVKWSILWDVLFFLIFEGKIKTHYCLTTRRIERMLYFGLQILCWLLLCLVSTYFHFQCMLEMHCDILQALSISFVCIIT